MKRVLAIIITLFALTYVINDSFTKEKSVFAITNKNYLLGGETVGIKLYAKGLICIDFEEVGGRNPAKEAGIKKGDIILSSNGKEITGTDLFIKIISESNGKVQISYDRDGKIYETYITPYQDESGNKKVGLWVRDSVAGVGTVSFTDVEKGVMVTLGHSVNDSDTGRRFLAQRGYITNCEIIDVDKSEEGSPGEIYGKFKEDESIYGYITENTEKGLYANIGKISGNIEKLYHIASEKEIHDGGALVYTDVVGGEIKGYSAEIKKCYSSGGSDLIVEIKDNRLIEKTGGIVQGMSGSPIVQDGKIVGVVTHVFINNPSSGYAIYAYRMAEIDRKY